MDGDEVNATGAAEHPEHALGRVQFMNDVDTGISTRYAWCEYSNFQKNWVLKLRLSPRTAWCWGQGW
jgi:hypothetical protein